MIKIDLYGDSTQVGNEPLNKTAPFTYAITTRPPSVILQEMFDAKYPNQVLVRNKGIGGTRMTEFWEGTGQYTRLFDAEMNLSDADIVVTNHGINDAYQNWPSNLYVQYVNAMATSATSKGKKFFIETPNPMTTSAAAVGNSYAKALYTTPVSELAGIIDVFRLVRNNFNYWLLDGLRDGFHPSEALYGYIGECLFTALEPCVRNLIENPPPPPPVPEDLTTYNEVDPANKFTITPDSLTFTNLSRADNAYLSRPFDPTGGFKIDFEYTMTNQPVGGINPHAWMMVLSDALNDSVKPNGGAGYEIGILIGRGSTPIIQLSENVNGAVHQTALQPLTLNVKYFCTFEKNMSVGANGTLYLKLYSNAQRTALTATLTLALHSNKTFDYLTILQSLNDGFAPSFSGLIANVLIKDGL